MSDSDSRTLPMLSSPKTSQEMEESSASHMEQPESPALIEHASQLQEQEEQGPVSLQRTTSEAYSDDSNVPPLSTTASIVSISPSAGVEIDGLGVKGYLSMRDEGVTYHRMKRSYCRCVGVNFFRFSSSSNANNLIDASFGSEITKVEEWDGRGLLHTYRNSFKLSFRHGLAFNVDAESEDDKHKWIEYIRSALQGSTSASAIWENPNKRERSNSASNVDAYPLSAGGLEFMGGRKKSRPKFQDKPVCVHPGCNARFDSTGRRQHHCRNCGGTCCSSHSSRFAVLRHFFFNEPVRLCVSCSRVQRFALWFSMLVQRLAIIQRTRGVLRPPMEVGEEDELEKLEELLHEASFGVTDMIQLLHMHRFGYDSTYARLVHKLMSSAEDNMADFEFFLPQLFHLWLTMDWISNNVKAALLFRAVCFAASLHIRLASNIYWLARAAVDDSCGWGFGQSELYVPSYLYNKFSMCKLLMLNLEMQLAGDTWSFKQDQDLPAPSHHHQMLSDLFDRLQTLLKEMKQTSKSFPFGPICEAVTISCIPAEFLDLSAGTEQRLQPTQDNRRVFYSHIGFVQQLCEMTERLRFIEVTGRKAALKQELLQMSPPVDAFNPLGSCLDPMESFLSIAKSEGTVFTTRARAPTLLMFEVHAQDALSNESKWLQVVSPPEEAVETLPEDAEYGATTVLDDTRSSSSSNDVMASSTAIEMAAKSDIAQALSMSNLTDAGGDQSHAMDTSGDWGGDDEDKDPASTTNDNDRDGPAPVSVTIVSPTRGNKSRRRDRSGSLMNSATDSLESMLAGWKAASYKNRRKRSASEGSEAPNDADNLAAGVKFNEVEKFRQDQFVSMAQNLERSLMESNPESRGVFSGKEAVSWMRRNELVLDREHAVWLGGELLASGALEIVTANHEGFEPSSDVMYRVATEFSRLECQENAHGQMSKSFKNSRPFSMDMEHRQTSLSATFSSNRLLSPHVQHEKTGMDKSQLTAVVDSKLTGTRATNLSNAIEEVEEDDNASSVFSQPSHAILDNFSPDITLAAMESIEIATQEQIKVHAGSPEGERLQEDLATLKDQVEVVCEYVRSKRKKRHNAVESAFGESFENKKERLRENSQHVQWSHTPRWDCTAFVVKSNDDLRQEVLCMQLIRQIQDIFQAEQLPLRLLPYSIIATSGSTGVIEYIKNATSLDRLKKRRGYTSLRDHFLKTYGNVETLAFKTAMGNFVQSMAAYSLVCYILRIKDRHNGNIMIDSDGHIVHIDFGFILGIAPGGRWSLETAPFKLTAEMVEAMGGTQSEYFKAYVIFLIQGFAALQRNAKTLLLMIGIMAQQSSCPCFLSQQPQAVLRDTENLFRMDDTQEEIVQYVIDLVRRSHNSYRTRQYDTFQRMTNGILP